MSKFGFEGVRIADDLIYSEPNYAEPKEIHKSILSIINQNNFPSDFSICDIGCAAGEFLSHAKNIFPECKIIGLDVSEILLTKAKEKLPEGEFLLETIEKENMIVEIQNCEYFIYNNILYGNSYAINYFHPYLQQEKYFDLNGMLLRICFYQFHLN